MSGFISESCMLLWPFIAAKYCSSWSMQLVVVVVCNELI